jgi:DNA-binding LytR/AlgR family response regulator
VNRALKPSSRPFIVFAVVYGLLALMGFYVRRPDVVLTSFGLYVVTMALIGSVRISVSDEDITIVRWYIFKKHVRFDDIDHSDVQYLAERDWPVMVTIHGKHRKGILTTIGLKVIRREDAAWLCSLEQLRTVVHPGLTSKS